MLALGPEHNGINPSPRGKGRRILSVFPTVWTSARETGAVYCLAQVNFAEHYDEHWLPIAIERD
jgi:hypothetical protein